MKFELITENKEEERNYTVEYIVECKDAKKSSIAKYTKGLKLIVKKDDSQKAVFRVEFGNLRKDNSRTCDNPIDHFFIKSSEALNKLDLSLTDDGQIESVLNRDETLKNWDYLRIYLERCFTSEDKSVDSQLKEWISHLDKLVKDDKAFLQAIRNDIVYYSLFCGLWKDFGEQNLIVIQKSFPFLLGDSKLVLREECHAIEPNGRKGVYVNGDVCFEETDIKEICQYLGIDNLSKDDIDVNLEGLYLFDAVGLINSIELFVVVKLRNNCFKKELGVVIKTI